MCKITATSRLVFSPCFNQNLLIRLVCTTCGRYYVALSSWIWNPFSLLTLLYCVYDNSISQFCVKLILKLQTLVSKPKKMKSFFFHWKASINLQYDDAYLPSELSRRHGGSQPEYFFSRTCLSPRSSPAQ